MSEICVESCALKRDTSAFELRPDLTLDDMPRFPRRDTKGMTKEERFTVVTIYLAMVVDHLKGIENEHGTTVIRRPHFDGSSGSGVFADLQEQDLLPGGQERDTTPQDWSECPDPTEGPPQLDERADQAT